MQSVETLAVVKTWAKLVQCVDVRNVIDVLIEERIVSLEESEYISKGQTTCEQSRRMLLKVVDCSDPATFNIFLRALQENYPFIVEEIHRKLSSLKRQRFKNSKQQHAVEVEYDLNITELERKLEPVEHGCSVCSMDCGCTCHVNCTNTNCTAENSAENAAASSHPPIEHAMSWSPSGSFETEHLPNRSRRGTFSFLPNTLVDATNAVRAAFGSFDIGRYQRISLIPPEFLEQLVDDSGGSDPTEVLRQLSLHSGDSTNSTPLRGPQENGTTPDISPNVSYNSRSNRVTADGTSNIQAPNGTATQPEMACNTSPETHVKQVTSNCTSVNRPPVTPESVIRPGRGREPTESTEGERDDTELKRVVTNGVCCGGTTQGGDTGGGKKAKVAQLDRTPANSVCSRISARFMGPPKKLRRDAAQPSHSNGTNGATKTVCRTCRRHVLITPHVIKGNTDYGFQLGTTTSTGGFSVDHVTDGGPAAGRLHQSDIIFSINSQEVRGLSKKKADKKIDSSDRQLALEVESAGEILEHRIGLKLSRSSPEESWGFSMIHGSLRPRYPKDIEFYCTAIDADSPVGRSGLLQVGDVLTGCEHINFAGKSQEEVNSIIRSMETLSLHIARKEFIRESDPKHGHSSC